MNSRDDRGADVEVDPDEPVWTTPATLGDEPVHRAEIVLAAVLRVGVVASLLLTIVGLGLVAALQIAGQPIGPILSPEESVYPTTLPAIADGIRAGEPHAFIALGLAVLIATPVVNVALVAIAFLVEADWPFVVVCGLILTLLALGLLLNATLG